MPPNDKSDKSVFTAAAPFVFVVLWSTGFIGSKLGTPFAAPVTFLAVRFAIVVALFLVLALVTRAPWPPFAKARHVIVVGILLHGIYLGGVFVSISWGLPAGVSALIVGLQPLLTATVVGPWLGEKVSPRQWLGLWMGLAGVLAVLWEKLALDGVALAAVWPSVAGLVGITAGTLYQKRFCPDVDLRTGAVFQYGAATLFLLPIALIFETMAIRWTPQFVFALTWLVLVLSVGAVSLLMVLVRRGAAAKVASFFYLVTPTTAVMAWLLFGETLGGVALAGMAVAAAGVALVQRS
ncbi:MAG: EamA family transporter [Alphaproteobacteria bacterium]|nr:EamA family transporter [Alphaproteobacteria bacterium]